MKDKLAQRGSHDGCRSGRRSKGSCQFFGGCLEAYQVGQDYPPLHSSGSWLPHASKLPAMARENNASRWRSNWGASPSVRSNIVRRWDRNRGCWDDEGIRDDPRTDKVSCINEACGSSTKTSICGTTVCERSCPRANNTRYYANHSVSSVACVCVHCTIRLWDALGVRCGDAPGRRGTSGKAVEQVAVATPMLDEVYECGLCRRLNPCGQAQKGRQVRCEHCGHREKLYGEMIESLCRVVP